MARQIVSVRSRVFVNRAQIAALNLPTGDIGRWADRQVELAADSARGFVEIRRIWPGPRTGRLGDSIGGDRTGSNQNGINFRLGADAPYARYVHEGTTGPIVADSGGPMPVGASQGSIVAMAMSVDGQRTGRGNPFLRDGLNFMLARNALRPIHG